MTVCGHGNGPPPARGERAATRDVRTKDKALNGTETTEPVTVDRLMPGMVLVASGNTRRRVIGLQRLNRGQWRVVLAHEDSDMVDIHTLPEWARFERLVMR